MPKPALGGLKRLRPEHRRVELRDEQLDAPIVVYLRPLLPTERDAIGEEAKDAVARYVTGGWVDANDQYRKDPEPIVIDGVRVPIDATFVRKLHRYAAMQRPVPGARLPADADPLDFAYMVEMTVTLLDAWPEFEQAASEVWVEGVTGKAFGMTPSDERPDGSSSAESPIPSPISTSAPESTTSAAPSE